MINLLVLFHFIKKKFLFFNILSHCSRCLPNKILRLLLKSGIFFRVHTPNKMYPYWPHSVKLTQPNFWMVVKKEVPIRLAQNLVYEMKQSFFFKHLHGKKIMKKRLSKIRLFTWKFVTLSVFKIIWKNFYTILSMYGTYKKKLQMHAFLTFCPLLEAW